MKWIEDRKAVAIAERRLVLTRRKYREDTRWLQASIRQHRSAIIVTSGLVGGTMAAALPLRAWLRTGIAMLSMGMAIARTPLGPLALGAFFARNAGADKPPTQND